MKSKPSLFDWYPGQIFLVGVMSLCAMLYVLAQHQFPATAFYGAVACISFFVTWRALKS